MLRGNPLEDCPNAPQNEKQKVSIPEIHIFQEATQMKWVCVRICTHHAKNSMVGCEQDETIRKGEEVIWNAGTEN